MRTKLSDTSPTNMNGAHKIGAISELKAQQHFIAAGYQVFNPVVRQGFTDFVVQIDGKYLGVQVKTACWVTTGQTKYLQTRLGRSWKSDQTVAYNGTEPFDLLVVVCDDRLWVIPKGELPEDKQTLYLDKTGSRPSKLTYNPKDWEICLKT